MSTATTGTVLVNTATRVGPTTRTPTANQMKASAEADAALNTLAAGFTRNLVCDTGKVQPEEGGAWLCVRTGASWFADVAEPRPDMRRFPAPVLVRQGQCDFVPYAEAYEYVDLFPDARYQFIAGAGHILWWEQPEAYAQAIAAFPAENPAVD